MANLQVHPQYQELLDNLKELKEELAKLIGERDRLVHNIAPNLTADYQVKIGSKRFESFCLECTVRRLKRKIALIQAAINNNEKFNITDIDARLDIELKEWETQLENMHKDLLDAKHRLDNLTSLNQEEAKELKEIYKKLIFKLHPDLNPDQTEEEKSLLQQVIKAYQAGDIETLKTLSLILNGEDINFQIFSGLDQIEAECSKYKEKIKSLISSIQRIKNSFPFNIETNLQNPVWVMQQNKDSEEKIQMLEQERQKLETVLAEYCTV